MEWLANGLQNQKPRLFTHILIIEFFEQETITNSISKKVTIAKKVPLRNK